MAMFSPPGCLKPAFLMRLVHDVPLREVWLKYSYRDMSFACFCAALWSLLFTVSALHPCARRAVFVNVVTAVWNTEVDAIAGLGGAATSTVPPTTAIAVACAKRRRVTGTFRYSVDPGRTRVHWRYRSFKPPTLRS